jgi:mono/diheme cytochrome c family protein
MKNRLRHRTMLVAGLATMLACPESQRSTPVPELPADPEEAARVVFEQRCMQCHGSSGGGDGSYAVELGQPPPNFRDPEWQASATDDRIEKVIVRGGEAMGLSRSMPAYPELANEPEVMAALRRQIRAYGR